MFYFWLLLVFGNCLFHFIFFFVCAVFWFRCWSSFGVVWLPWFWGFFSGQVHIATSLSISSFKLSECLHAPQRSQKCGLALPKPLQRLEHMHLWIQNNQFNTASAVEDFKVHQILRLDGPWTSSNCWRSERRASPACQLVSSTTLCNHAEVETWLWRWSTL